MRPAFKVVLTLGLAASAACASAGSGPEPMYRPEVSVKEVRLSGVGISGGSMNIDLELRNPNRFRIEAPVINYRVLVDTVQIGSGVYEADFSLRGRRSTEIRIPVRFKYSDIGPTGRKLLSSGTVEYRIVGDVTAGSTHGPVAGPYDRSGEFSTMSVLRRLPGI
jgi:LEA14-like dessication related protein